MGAAVPKQFLDLCGIPILARTIEIFDKSPEIADIILAIPDGYEQYVRENILGPRNFGKCRSVVTGGRDRMASVYAGIRAASGDTEILIVHDGVRPFTSGREISRVIAGAGRYGACAPAVRLKETLKYCPDGDFAEATPDRDEFRLIQTPQAFRFEIIKEAYEYAVGNGLYASDDASVAEMIGVKTYLVDGNYDNIKITTVEDTIFAEAMVKKV